MDRILDIDIDPMQGINFKIITNGSKKGKDVLIEGAMSPRAMNYHRQNRRPIQSKPQQIGIQ